MASSSAEGRGVWLGHLHWVARDWSRVDFGGRSSLTWCARVLVAEGRAVRPPRVVRSRSPSVLRWARVAPAVLRHALRSLALRTTENQLEVVVVVGEYRGRECPR
jgi:hypothetical protein